MIAAADAELGNQGREKAELVAELDGPHLVTVEVAEGASPGRYLIQIEELRTASEKDVLAQEARKLDIEANRLYEAQKLDEALAVAERSLTVHEQSFGPDGVETATALHTFGMVIYEYRRNFAKAETLHRRALALRERALGPNHPRVADSLTRLSELYAATGDFATAVPLRERELEIEERTLGTNNLAITSSLKSLAAFYSRKGDEAKALALSERVLAINESALGPDHPEVARALRDLASVYSGMGDNERAESLLKRAVAILEKAKIVGLVTVCLNSLGVIYGRKGDDVTAEQFFQRALTLEVAASSPESSTAAFYTFNLGTFYWQTKDYAKGEQYLQRALEIWEKRFGPDYRNLALVLSSMAALNIQIGNLDRAQSQLERALKIRQKALGENHRDVLTILNRLAWVHAMKGDTAQAVTFGSRANDVWAHDLDVNLADTSERQKLAFLASLPDQLNQALTLHIRFAPDDPAAVQAAVTAILQRKGLVQEKMADTLSAMRRRLGSADRSLFDEWNAATSRLAKVVLDGPQRLSPAEHNKRVKAIEDEREKLEAEIARRSGGFFPRTQTLTLAAVQAAIPEGAALVEFAVYRPFDPKAVSAKSPYGEPRYAAYVVRPGGALGWRDLGPAREIDEAITSWRGALRDPERNDVNVLARAVNAKVMLPIQPLLGDATHLLLSPDGELNLIPFEALIDERGHYLVEGHLISYLTSGRDLLRMQVARESKSKPVVIANPFFGQPATDLTAKANSSSRLGHRRRGTVTGVRDLNEVYFVSLAGTAVEGNSIRKLFDASLLTGAEATESAVKQLSAPRVLHIATHGFFLSEPSADAAGSAKASTRGLIANVKIENPLLRSGLALANANSRSSGNDDGILTALEASGLNLWGTKLVVLSACDTGVGEVRNGEGVYGLRRAFVLAGAESLIMSLWPVSDYTTRELMANYYKNLKLGLGRGEALRAVQLDMLKRNPKLHPVYWANFIQSGEWANLAGQR
jgi:CHAT domain-containing protein/Tfp pilus assembly protein PilF